MHPIQHTEARAPLRIYLARRIYTMDESLPEATAVGVIGDRIVAVGDLASMEPWREGREVVVDTRLQDKVLLPGFIENHVHPFLGAFSTPMEIIAPEAWRMPGGVIMPAANSPERYLALLKERLAANTDHEQIFMTFGYQPGDHGVWTRQMLDELCPDRPIVLWQRSFHETIVNTKLIEHLKLDDDEVRAHPQADLARGRFFETGTMLMIDRLRPLLLSPAWYRKGLNMFADLLHQGGITTVGDMLFGAVDVDYELAALDACIEQAKRPVRIVNIPDIRSFSNRAIGQPSMTPPDVCPPYELGLQAYEALLPRATHRVQFSKAVKLFADGAMFSQMMQMRPPGYIDGHQGEWLMSPAVLAEGVRVCWNAGYQLHVHVNGDAGMDVVIDQLAAAQERKPRFDHRFTVHHVGFHTNAQSRKLAALGAHASVNPYYIYSLSDNYSRLGLGPERASQIVRARSLIEGGMRVSFHSDFMMAPLEPLMLAWCAGSRTSQAGQRMGPEECLSLDQALRGITIDAAFALGMDDEIGSIVAGKKADFAVLDADPFELGLDRLIDVPVAGTVFEGALHLLPQAVASVLSGAPMRPKKAPSRSLYKPISDACGPNGDSCSVLRLMACFARTGVNPSSAV